MRRRFWRTARDVLGEAFVQSGRVKSRRLTKWLYLMHLAAGRRAR